MVSLLVESSCWRSICEGCVEKLDGDRRRGDSGTRGLGDVATHLTICLTFHHISQNPRLLIVTALYPGLSFSFVQCETEV